VSDAGVADVGAVQEGEEVEKGKPGDEPFVNFPDERFVLRSMSAY